ncbi:hypothetical protein HK104_006916, partial [Borealophlyctis nickersoniae]
MGCYGSKEEPRAVRINSGESVGVPGAGYGYGQDPRPQSRQSVYSRPGSRQSVRSAAGRQGAASPYHHHAPRIKDVEEFGPYNFNKRTVSLAAPSLFGGRQSYWPEDPEYVQQQMHQMAPRRPSVTIPLAPPGSPPGSPPPSQYYPDYVLNAYPPPPGSSSATPRTLSPPKQNGPLSSSPGALSSSFQHQRMGGDEEVQWEEAEIQDVPDMLNGKPAGVVGVAGGEEDEDDDETQFEAEEFVYMEDEDEFEEEMDIFDIYSSSRYSLRLGSLPRSRKDNASLASGSSQAATAKEAGGTGHGNGNGNGQAVGETTIEIAELSGGKRSSRRISVIAPTAAGAAGAPTKPA